MAKYDWKQLEKEYILGNYKSVNSFLKEKGISRNKTTNTQTKEWNIKKHQKDTQTTSRTVEKIIEKQSEKEAKKITKVKDVANDLLQKIIQANNELNMHLARNKKKTKTVEYDYRTNKPSKETIQEDEEIKSYIDIIDRKGLKELTSALKDLNDILTNRDENRDNTQSLAEVIQKAYESKVGDK